MKKAAFKLILESDKDYTQEQIDEIKNILLHTLKAEIETGNIPYTTGFRIRRTWTTPSITPSAHFDQISQTWIYPDSNEKEKGNSGGN